MKSIKITLWTLEWPSSIKEIIENSQQKHVSFIDAVSQGEVVVIRVQVSLLRWNLFRVGRHVCADVLRHFTVEWWLGYPARTSIHNNVLISLVKFNLEQSCRLTDLAIDWIPNENSDVLSSWCYCFKVRHVFVNVLMIQRLHDAVVHDIFQFSQVHHHPSLSIDWSSDGNFDTVIVTMTVQTVTLSKNFVILFVWQVNATITLNPIYDIFSSHLSHY